MAGASGVASIIFFDDGVGGEAFGLAFEVEDEAVAEAGEEDGADVGEGDVVAAVAEGEDFGGEDDGLGAAGAGAVADVFFGDLGEHSACWRAWRGRGGRCSP